MINSFTKAVRFLFAKGNRTSQLYDILGEKGLAKHPKTKIPSVNMGFWRDIKDIKGDSLHESNRALFKLVCEGASFSENDKIALDAGCGFGTNIQYCVENSPVQKMIGLNISPNQIEWGNKYLAENGHSSRAEIIMSSATDMLFADESVDKIVSIEAAFHFDTRENFFQEAKRVLKPNGILSMADLIVCKPQTFLQRLLAKNVMKTLFVPAPNVMNYEEYVEKIRESGLEILEVECIGQDVVPGFRKWFWKQPIKDMFTYNMFWSISSVGFMLAKLDYIRVIAKKLPE
jgi:cyclopropane fatty-acyl-phospholipid synthase-like methyltransferase